MTPLHRGEIRFCGVILIEFLLDVVVDGLKFFLQEIEELGDGFVRTVFYFIPLEGLKVVFYGPCIILSINALTPGSS